MFTCINKILKQVVDARHHARKIDFDAVRQGRQNWTSTERHHASGGAGGGVRTPRVGSLQLKHARKESPVPGGAGMNCHQSQYTYLAFHMALAGYLLCGKKWIKLGLRRFQTSHTLVAPVVRSKKIKNGSSWDCSHSQHRVPW